VAAFSPLHSEHDHVELSLDTGKPFVLATYVLVYLGEVSLVLKQVGGVLLHLGVECRDPYGSTKKRTHGSDGYRPFVEHGKNTCHLATYRRSSGNIPIIPGEEMDEKVGVKEVSEMIEALMELGLAIASVAKDGISLSDIPALYGKMQSPELQPKLVAAADRMNAIPDEVKDLDLAEGMQLAMLVLPYVPKYVEVLAKKGE
jgi:biotin operon repressor